MKSRKIAVAVVIGSVMVSALCGCNKEIVTEPTETDEETKTTETSEETVTESFGEFSPLYTLYRDYATDLHNASDADLRFGC